ncbi:MAG: TonB-dependent receptor [Acidobacteria bacterium]|nr:TonB-dependent receptor [Acidobacteriota bacterium]
MKSVLLLLLLTLFSFSNLPAQTDGTRTLAGVVITPQFERVANVAIEVDTANGKLNFVADGDGSFAVKVPDGPVTVKISGKNIAAFQQTFSALERIDDLRLKITYVIPQIAESVVIEDDVLAPDLENRNDTIYKNFLFSRDDQLVQTLNAGINAGQHEGGGKSLEIRRFGFNMDHGGVNGGLKVLVDNVQQNQATQGHGQGYLGSLKSLSPELVEDVSIINGPFSAQYGDFSGLGVVHIRQKEGLPQLFTARVQTGSHNSFRTFLAYSPEIRNVRSFVAYEGSRTDGPFILPLNYKRDNLTGNFTRDMSGMQTIGFKFNLARNTYDSSGQIPLDEVAAGRLDRFGAFDKFTGGNIYSSTAAVYFRKDLKSGASFKADAFLARSLFDLFSNFTFFLNDETNGDEILQHDSRLQEGANVQYQQPYMLFGGQSLLTIGGNLHFNQINVGLDKAIARDPFLNIQKAQANVDNYATYIQNGLDLFDGHLHIEAGLRVDYFTFDVNERVDPTLSGKESAVRLQPKFSAAWSPFEKLPTTFYFNYGRGIASQDARGVVKNPDAPKVSTTDFYQAGTSYNSKRFSVASSLFLIDRSNEQVFIADDNTIEFAGPSRSYGFEVKTSARFTRWLSFNSGVTRVLEAFYIGTTPREFVDSAPHLVANASLVFTEVKGFNSSINWRHINSYRLDPLDDSIRAAGHDVVDLAISKRLKRWVDVNVSIDNLLNKRYFETQNYFESRLRPGGPAVSRIHATPGYPFTVSLGLTFRIGARN